MFITHIALAVLGAALIAQPAVYAADGLEQVNSTGQSEATRETPTPSVAMESATLPPDYVIGAEDLLTIVFWRDKDMSGDVIVRPDGKISLPLLNDVPAAGLTPEQLRLQVIEMASRYVQDPNATVVVRQINSRKVFITGEVEKPGPYALAGPITVLQLIAIAGGFREYADREKIIVMRNDGGRPTAYRFNYREVIKQKNIAQNIELKPGDTVVVP